MSFYFDLVLLKSKENKKLFSSDFNKDFFITRTVENLLEEKNIENSQFDMQKISRLLELAQKNYSVPLVSMFFL